MRKPMSYSGLSVKDGLIMKGKRIVIPETLQQVLEQLHTGHQGMMKCKEPEYQFGGQKSTKI